MALNPSLLTFSNRRSAGELSLYVIGLDTTIGLSEFASKDTKRTFEGDEPVISDLTQFHQSPKSFYGKETDIIDIKPIGGRKSSISLPTEGGVLVPEIQCRYDTKQEELRVSARNKSNSYKSGAKGELTISQQKIETRLRTTSMRWETAGDKRWSTISFNGTLILDVKNHGLVKVYSS